MKIGQLVRTYTSKAFRYCNEGDHQELIRLMDARYSKLPGSNGRRVGPIERTPFRRRYSRFDLHAFPLAGVEALMAFMKEFEAKNG